MAATGSPASESWHHRQKTFPITHPQHLPPCNNYSTTKKTTARPKARTHGRKSSNCEPSKSFRTKRRSGRKPAIHGYPTTGSSSSSSHRSNHHLNSRTTRPFRSSASSLRHGSCSDCGRSSAAVKRIPRRAAHLVPSLCFFPQAQAVTVWPPSSNGSSLASNRRMPTPHSRRTSPSTSSPHCGSSSDSGCRSYNPNRLYTP